MLEPLHFVHISDTHLGPTAAYRQHGFRSLPCAERLVEVINRLPLQPDFVVHTGDVATDPHPQAYRLAAGIFRRLRAPIYYVTGNHDRATDIRRWLPMGPHEPQGEEGDGLFYRFERKGYRFLVLDARGPDEIDPHGLLPAGQLAYVRREVAAGGPPLLLFTHFPLLPLNAPWMDANMLMLNGEELHQALMPAAGRVRGIFHGHVHQARQTVRDGLLYVSVASAFVQFGAWPVDVEASLDPGQDPGFNFVTLLPGQTIVHQHTFPRPDGRMPATPPA